MQAARAAHLSQFDDVIVRAPDSSPQNLVRSSSRRSASGRARLKTPAQVTACKPSRPGSIKSRMVMAGSWPKRASHGMVTAIGPGRRETVLFQKLRDQCELRIVFD